VERERGEEAAAVAAERRGRAERSREEEEREGRGQVAEEEAVVEELRMEIVGGEGELEEEGSGTHHKESTVLTTGRFGCSASSALT
jgi:hypothetical protein